MPTAKFTDEIVEDSEPEREQLREQRRQKRRVEKAQKTAKSNVVAVVEKEVIELTDDEPSHNERLAQLQTIEVSDDSYAASPILAAIMNSPSPVSSPHVPPSVSVLEISSDSSVESVVVVNPVQLNPPSPQNLERHILNDFAMDHTPFFGHNQGSPPSSKLDLARFAFKGPHLPSRPKSPKPCPSRSESSIEKMPPPAEPKKKANRKDPSLFLDDISDAQLNLLGKCISCGIKWTTRKGASQKRAHIKSCSKKRAFSNDTLRLLIRREIDAAPVLTLDKGKGKLKAPEEPAISASVFDTVVNEAAPKKRSKRKEVVETVKEPTTRRESILAKAKGILGHEGQSTEMPATQSFGQSGLGRAKKSIMFGDSEEDSDQEVPPSTRAFIPSKFGRPARESPWDLMGAPPSPVLAESDVTNRVASGSKLAGSSRRSRTSSSSTEQSPRRVSRKRISTDLPHTPTDYGRNSPLQDSWDEDDGIYLHYDPAFDNTTESFQPILIGPPTTPKKTRKTKKSLSNSDTDTDTKKKRASKKKGKEKAIEKYPPLDEQWELSVREKIEQNLDLHHRILRYEPIHFDVFLQLALGDYSGPRLPMKLRLSLRNLLDKLGINFYGSESKGRR